MLGKNNTIQLGDSRDSEGRTTNESRLGYSFRFRLYVFIRGFLRMWILFSTFIIKLKRNFTELEVF
jgi:hypothetical protein